MVLLIIRVTTLTFC